MDTSKNDMVRYCVGTYKTMQYFNGTVNSTLLHYFINFTVNSPIKNPGQSPQNDNLQLLLLLRVPIRSETVRYGTF